MLFILKTQTLYLEAHDSWKISQIKEIVEAKAGQMEIPGFDNNELDDLLEYLCTQ